MDVILVNEQDEVQGSMEKQEAHVKGFLHRAFSIFVFNKKGEMLLQQRASGKYHSPELWTNACCSHPSPGEETEQAAHRRLDEELGFDIPIQYAFHFIYKAHFENGLTEYEFDHVYIGFYEGNIKPNVNEVMAYTFLPMETIRRNLQDQPDQYTAWFKIAFPMLETYLAKVNHPNG